MNVVLIPAYKPNTTLIQLVNELFEHGFKIVVVDDGSGKKYTPVFQAIKDKVIIITLEENCGKGAALKAGMKYIKRNLPECEAFITCDADGQHKVADVVRVGELLNKGNKFVLTIRQRKGKIPFRSKFGNDLSKIVYTLLTNRYLSDNQSGLRGFHIYNLDWMIDVEKNSYDYEMNVLYYAAKMGLKISTLPIEAIYIENNASSHFNPIVDTFKIYKSLFSLAKDTMLSFVFIEVLAFIFGMLYGNKYILFFVPFVGVVSLFIRAILHKLFFLKWCVSARGALFTVIYTIVSYFVYTPLCMMINFLFPKLPFFATFNLVYLLCLPLHFFLHKLMFIHSIKKE